MPNRIDLPTEEVISEYRRDASVNQLAKKYRVSRAVITRLLREQQVEVRSLADQARIVAAQMTPEEKIRRTRGAFRANCGRKRPYEVLCKRAEFRQKNGQTTERQRKWHERLQPHVDSPFVHRFAIGPYNVSLALPHLKIAVEIFEQSYSRAGLPVVQRPKRQFLEERDWIFFNVGDTDSREARLHDLIEQLKTAVAKRQWQG